jgi:hypothetical protein
MRITFPLPVLVGLLLLFGCSQRDTVRSGAAKDSAHGADLITFSDGTTLEAQTRNGQNLNGVRMVRKSKGEETYVAERGKLTEEPGGVFCITLYNAQVDRGSQGRMAVDELTIRLMR